MERTNRRWMVGALGALAAAAALFSESPPTGLEQLLVELEAGQHRGIEAVVMQVAGESRARWVSAKVPAEGPDLRSATKSVTALLVGIAIDRGELESVGQRVIDLLPEYRELLEKDPRKAKMRIADLLTMRSGLDCDDWNPKSPGHEDTMYRKRDWIEFWASRPMAREPGEAFSYCTGNVVALGKILANATGQPVDRYAEKVLFGPLGITTARWERWNRNREIDTGGHLRLHPDAFLRVGELVLGSGEYHGKRLVSAAWIAAMTTEHTPIPDRPQRYGYLWWLDQTRREDLPRTRVLMAWGNGGNFLVVMPEVASVVVFAGTRYNKPEGLEPLRWLGERILPDLVVTPSDGAKAAETPPN